MKKYFFIFLSLTIIVMLGAVLRFWGILHGSFAFTYDVGRDLLAVRDLVYNHKFSLLGPTSGQIGIFYGPWWYWLLAIPFVLSGGNPVFISLFIALTGVLAIILAYGWGKSKGERFALVLAGIIALAPEFISSTTQIWSPDLLILGTLLVIILLSQIKNLNNTKIIVLGFLLALLTEMEIVFGVIFLIGILISFLVWERKFLLSRKIIFFLAGLTLVELPRLLFELRHNFLQTRVLVKIWENKDNFAYHLDTRLQLVWEKWQAVMPFHNPYLGFIFSLLILWLFLSAFNKLVQPERKFFKELLLIAGLYFLFTLVYPKEVWGYYLMGLPVVWAIFISLSLSGLAKMFPKKIFWAVLILYLIFLSQPGHIIASIKNPEFTGNAAVFRNQLQVVDYVYQQADGYDFNYIAYTPPQIEYTWRYLFWWYGRQKYQYEPAARRQERFYVIIEPDPGYEDRITMWLKIRENDGKVAKDYKFPSGIIVQTRARPKE